MSDTFAFRALPVPLHRRVNLRVVKAVVAGCLVVATVSGFARWTIRSEQASLATAAQREMTSEAAVHGSVTPIDAGLMSGTVAVSADDLAAQDVARHTLARAQRLFDLRGTLSEARPGQRNRGSHGLTYTDGPSIGPTIVSVAGTNAVWGAAVMSESGLCFAVRLDAAGTERYGAISSDCTGSSALRVTGLSW